MQAANPHLMCAHKNSLSREEEREIWNYKEVKEVLRDKIQILVFGAVAKWNLMQLNYTMRAGGEVGDMISEK